MKFRDTVLSEIRQTRQDRHRVIPLTGGPWLARPTETGSRWREPGAGEAGRESVFTGDRGSVWEGEKVLEVDGVLAALQCKCT